MHNFTLYTTGCSKCLILEQQLKNKNISFSKITDLETLMFEADKHQISSAPFLKIDSVFYDFRSAMRFINAYENN